MIRVTSARVSAAVPRIGAARSAQSSVAPSRWICSPSSACGERERANHLVAHRGGHRRAVAALRRLAAGAQLGGHPVVLEHRTEVGHAEVEGERGTHHFDAGADPRRSRSTGGSRRRSRARALRRPPASIAPQQTSAIQSAELIRLKITPSAHLGSQSRPCAAASRRGRSAAELRAPVTVARSPRSGRTRPGGSSARPGATPTPRGRWRRSRACARRGDSRRRRATPRSTAAASFRSRGGSALPTARPSSFQPAPSSPACASSP